MSVGDLLTVPNMASRTGRRLSDALLQVVPNFPMSTHSPVSKLAKALAKHMDKKAAGQQVRRTTNFFLVYTNTRLRLRGFLLAA